MCGSIDHRIYRIQASNMQCECTSTLNIDNLPPRRYRRGRHPDSTFLALNLILADSGLSYHSSTAIFSWTSPCNTGITTYIFAPILWCIPDIFDVCMDQFHKFSPSYPNRSYKSDNPPIIVIAIVFSFFVVQIWIPIYLFQGLANP